MLIESSEPVAYVTSQPDPLTVLVDLRNVKAGRCRRVLGPLPPVADVRVEEAVAGDGAEVARVRVTLAYAAKHRVRSSRNVIYVEVDRAVVPHPEAKPRDGVELREARRGQTPRHAATALKSVRAIDNGIAIEADGRLVASAVEEAKDQPPALPARLPRRERARCPRRHRHQRGAIERVRVGANSATPVVTRVVIDLVKRAPFRVGGEGRRTARAVRRRWHRVQQASRHRRCT